MFKRTFSLIAAVAVIGTTLGTAAAYRDDAPPYPTTQLRQKVSMRDLHSPMVTQNLSNFMRRRAVADTSGHRELTRARPESRTALRSYNRHVLGWSRDRDYRVLDTRGGAARVVHNDLPPMLVQTGARSARSRFGDWGYDRPTRRDIRGDRNLRHQ